MSLWEKIEDWMDKHHMEHSYITYGKEGELLRIQSSGRNYCQGAHYLSSSAYNLSGTKKLTWKRIGDRGHQVNEKGKPVKTWKSYVAVILFKTIQKWKNKRMIHVWDGKTKPQLLFKRSKSAFKRAIDSNYKKSPYIQSKYVDVSEAESINVPKDFLEYCTMIYGSLLGWIEIWENDLKKESKLGCR